MKYFAGVTGDGQVDFVGDALVGHVIFARELEPKVSRSDNAVVVLDDHLIDVPSQTFLHHSTLIIIIIIQVQ